MWALARWAPEWVPPAAVLVGIMTGVLVSFLSALLVEFTTMSQINRERRTLLDALRVSTSLECVVVIPEHRIDVSEGGEQTAAAFEDITALVQFTDRLSKLAMPAPHISSVQEFLTGTGYYSSRPRDVLTVICIGTISNNVSMSFIKLADVVELSDREVPVSERFAAFRGEPRRYSMVGCRCDRGYIELA